MDLCSIDLSNKDSRYAQHAFLDCKVFAEPIKFLLTLLVVALVSVLQYLYFFSAITSVINGSLTLEKKQFVVKIYLFHTRYPYDIYKDMYSK